MKESVLAVLPAVNAVLVTTSGVLIAVGVRHIKQGRRESHERSMLWATALAALFLVFYIYRLAQGGTSVFVGPDWARAIYFFVLFSHIGVAIVSTPLVLLVLWQALRRNFAAHRRWARVTYPLWLYVAATGPLVYVMLHHWF